MEQLSPQQPTDFDDIPIRGLGQTQYVAGERVQAGGERLDERLRVAKLSGDHVWTVVVQHLINDPEHIGPDMVLDAESVTSVAAGCYVCEQVYSPRLRHRRCTGEPRR